MDGVKRDESGEAAKLGTACHTALERFVKHEATQPTGDWGSLPEYFQQVVIEDYHVATQDEILEQGLPLMEAWVERQDRGRWAKKKVVSVEAERYFEVETSQGPVKFLYYIDREDYDPEEGLRSVVDYKSGFWMLKGRQLREDEQTAVYLVALRKLYPDESHYRMTFDYLRGREETVIMSNAQVAALEASIVETIEEMIACENPTETVNKYCSWCDRRSACDAFIDLSKQEIPTTWSIDQLARRKLDLESASKALKQNAKDVDAAIENFLEQENLEVAVSESGVKIGASRKQGDRKVDQERAKALLSAGELAENTTVTVTLLDGLIKNETDPERRAELEACIGRQDGKVKLWAKSTK